MHNGFSSREEFLDARMKWAFAVMATEIDRGRRLGYIPGTPRTEVTVDEMDLSADLDARLTVLDRAQREAVDPFANLRIDEPAREALWLLACCDLEPALARLAEAVCGQSCLTDRFLERVFGFAIASLTALGIAELDARESGSSARGLILSARILSQVLGRTQSLRPSQPGTDLIVHPDVKSRLDEVLGVASAVIVLSASAASGRRSLCVDAITRKSGRDPAVVDLRCIATEPTKFSHALRALALECRLTGKVPLLCNLDALADEKGERLAIVANEFSPLIEGNILVTCGVQRPNVTWDRPVIVIEMGQPTHAQRARLWHEALGCGTDEDAQRLANQYPLAPALIVRAAQAANARAAGRELEPADIYAGIKTVLDDGLGMYARRVTITQTWDDIVLPADQAESIAELIARVRGRHKVYEQWGFGAKVGRGLGVSALFSGPPGTGKTMVAGLIAKELGLELYQVDMAKVVSKFIGETEKNLAALFDAAEAGHAILLFDEADSLFGKRTDVKTSNDRFANLETNYLLQRLETFTGICLLTSNHESNMDPAFQRRLSLHLRFELPDVEERAQLWRAVIPADAPVAPGVDFAGLARRFAMSGGYIKNAALRAAFIAADQGKPITAAHLERAARVEYEGMGKIAS